MTFTDMHIHALSGVDDGAQTTEKMMAMIDKSYADGVRRICLTPHFHPGYFGDNREAAELSYRRLCKEAAQRWPDLRLGLGNELRYDDGCISWLKDGVCRTMNGTDYVLVDFYGEGSGRIHRGLDRLLNAGYLPILAHAERYRSLQKRDYQEFRDNGILIQIDTQSLFYGFGFQTARRCRQILKLGLASMAGSDAHDLERRPPGMARFYEAVVKNYGRAYAGNLCGDNAEASLFSNNAERERDL